MNSTAAEVAAARSQSRYWADIEPRNYDVYNLMKQEYMRLHAQEAQLRATGSAPIEFIELEPLTERVYGVFKQMNTKLLLLEG